jgi:hypothetical protein
MMRIGQPPDTGGGERTGEGEAGSGLALRSEVETETSAFRRREPD